MCSHWEPVIRPSDLLPCVIYCHGNCGSRCDAVEASELLLPYGITVLAFDFTGSGQSEGAFEQHDIACVVEYLRSTGKVSKIGLWGRSMGAASSLLYAANDPSIAGMVLDSPFSSLSSLTLELAGQFSPKLPKFLVRIALKVLRRSIINRAHFDIEKCNPSKVVQQCFVPVLFGHGKHDTFIIPRHSEELQYAGDKNLVQFPGDHNSQRPEFFLDSVCIFFYNALLASSGSMFERPTDLHTPVRKRFDAGTLTPRRLNFDMEKLALLASASAHEDAHSNAEATAIVPDESRPLASAFAPVPLDEDSEQQMLMQALCASLQDMAAECNDAENAKHLEEVRKYTMLPPKKK